jgi:hypothetical protein
MTRRTGLKGSSVDRKAGWLLIFFFLRDRRRFRTRSVRNCADSSDWRCHASHPQPSEMVLFMITSPGPARNTCDRPSAAELRPLVAGASGAGQDDQRRLLYANRKVLISPVGENLLVLGGLVFTDSMHSRQSCPDVCDFSPAQPGRAAPRIRASRRSEPGVRRDAWCYPLHRVDR